MKSLMDSVMDYVSVDSVFIDVFVHHNQTNIIHSAPADSADSAGSTETGITDSADSTDSAE